MKLSGRIHAKKASFQEKLDLSVQKTTLIPLRVRRVCE